MSESLEPKLREAALTVLRRYGTSDEDLQVEEAEEGKPSYTEYRGHRIKITVNATSAQFLVKGGRWSGDRADYPSAGSFIADFEAMLSKAMSGNWR